MMITLVFQKTAVPGLAKALLSVSGVMFVSSRRWADHIFH